MVSVDNLLPEKGIHNKIVSILLEVQDVNDPTTPKEVTDKIMAMLQSLRETQSNHEAIAKKKCKYNVPRKKITERRK